MAEPAPQATNEPAGEPSRRQTTFDYLTQRPRRQLIAAAAISAALTEGLPAPARAVLGAGGAALLLASLEPVSDPGDSGHSPS